MADIVKFEDIKRLYSELVKDIDVDKTRPEKFISSLLFAYPENIELLKREDINVKLTKPSQWSILAIEPQELEKRLLRGRDLGFLAAYQQNPVFVKVDADTILKRMSECDAYGIKYVNEKGKYASWLFSNRAYAYVTGSVVKKEEPSVDGTPSVDYEVAKEYATRVMESFNLQSEAEKIYKHLEELMNSNLDFKKLLMETFKEYAVDNEAFLSDTIDKIMSLDKEEKRGRVAAWVF